MDVHRGLPRQGPGRREDTLAALDVAVRACGEPRVVVDVGCGPGMQTLHLAERLPESRLLALDLHAVFLEELGRRAADAGLAERVRPIRADMRRLPIRPASADLIWCEGAAYIMGVRQALETWRSLLRAGGACAFTDAVWLAPDPPAPARAFWRAYPAMGDVRHNRALIHEAGYELLGDLVLPAAAWWDDYYGPMEMRLDALEQRHHRDAGALGALAEWRNEIDVYRRFGDWYGYAFFVARSRRGGR